MSFPVYMTKSRDLCVPMIAGMTAIGVISLAKL